MGAYQATVVFLDDENSPGPVEKCLLEHRGSGTLAAEDEDGPASITGHSHDGTGHALRAPPTSCAAAEARHPGAFRLVGAHSGTLCSHQF